VKMYAPFRSHISKSQITVFHLCVHGINVKDKTYSRSSLGLDLTYREQPKHTEELLGLAVSPFPSSMETSWSLSEVELSGIFLKESHKMLDKDDRVCHDWRTHHYRYDDLTESSSYVVRGTNGC
jgi:hypothetical protein